MSEISQRSLSMSETNDCTVKAFMYLTGHTYNDSHKALADEGRKPQKGCSLAQQLRAYSRAGFLLEEIKVAARTIRNAERELTSGRFLVKVSGHVLAVIDGLVHDWSAGSCRRIQRVYKVSGQFVETADALNDPARRKYSKRPKHTYRTIWTNRKNETVVYETQCWSPKHDEYRARFHGRSSEYVDGVEVVETAKTV